MDRAKSAADTALLPKEERYVGAVVEQKYVREDVWIFCRCECRCK